MKMKAILLSITTIFWMLSIGILFLYNVALLNGANNASFLPIIAVSLFVIGILPIAIGFFLCYRIDNYKKIIENKLKPMNENERLIELNKIAKYDFMDENGALNNWKGLVYLLKLQIPKYAIMKGVIDALRNEKSDAVLSDFDKKNVSLN